MYQYQIQNRDNDVVVATFLAPDDERAIGFASEYAAWISGKVGHRVLRMTGTTIISFGAER